LARRRRSRSRKRTFSENVMIVVGLLVALSMIISLFAYVLY